jgi:hypothetical protein
MTALTTARLTTFWPSDLKMLAKLQRLWLIEATKYNVLPMDDRTSERLERTMAGRLIRVTPSCSSSAWDASWRTVGSASTTSPSRSPPRWMLRTTASRVV